MASSNHANNLLNPQPNPNENLLPCWRNSTISTPSKTAEPFSSPSRFVSGASASFKGYMSSESSLRESPAKRRKVLAEKSRNTPTVGLSPLKKDVRDIGQFVWDVKTTTHEVFNLGKNIEGRPFRGVFSGPTATEHAPSSTEQDKIASKHNAEQSFSLNGAASRVTQKRSHYEVEESSTESDSDGHGLNDPALRFNKDFAALRERSQYEQHNDTPNTDLSLAQNTSIYPTNQRAPIPTSQPSFSSLINYNAAAVSFTEPLQQEKAEEDAASEVDLSEDETSSSQKESGDCDHDTPLAQRLRLRLNLAMFKVNTYQMYVPLSKLEIIRRR